MEVPPPPRMLRGSRRWRRAPERQRPRCTFSALWRSAEEVQCALQTARLPPLREGEQLEVEAGCKGPAVGVDAVTFARVLAHLPSNVPGIAPTAETAGDGRLPPCAPRAAPWRIELVCGVPTWFPHGQPQSPPAAADDALVEQETRIVPPSLRAMLDVGRRVVRRGHLPPKRAAAVGAVHGRMVAAASATRGETQPIRVHALLHALLGHSNTEPWLRCASSAPRPASPFASRATSAAAARGGRAPRAVPRVHTALHRRLTTRLAAWNGYGDAGTRWRMALRHSRRVPLPTACLPDVFTPTCVTLRHVQEWTVRVYPEPPPQRREAHRVLLNGDGAPPSRATRRAQTAAGERRPDAGSSRTTTHRVCLQSEKAPDVQKQTPTTVLLRFIREVQGASVAEAEATMLRAQDSRVATPVRHRILAVCVGNGTEVPADGASDATTGAATAATSVLLAALEYPACTWSGGDA